MLTSLQAPLFFGLIAAFVTTLGLIAVAVRSDWSARNADMFALVAGGMLVTLVLLHIAPEAFARSSGAAVWLLGGYLGGLMLSQGLRAFTSSTFGTRASTGPAEALTPILAIAVHSFIDGIIYSVTFAASFESGAYAALSLIMHEFPEGVIAFAILRGAGISNRSAFVWAFLAAAATTPLGVLVSGPFMFTVGADLLGDLFAVSAGLLLFVATGPLLAPSRDGAPWRNLGAISAGVAIAALIAVAPIHNHDHGTGDGHDHSDDHHEHPNFAPEYR